MVSARAYPLKTLTTGRVRDHWHTLTRTMKSPALRSRTPEPILEVNANDAKRAGIQDGSFARTWILENQAGRPFLNAQRRQEKDHQIEVVGRELRRKMSYSMPGVKTK